MSQKTPIYNLEYLEYGSNYSASIDYRRFVTLDYNMKSYVGVVGVGVISGWTIDPIGSLNIQILPGKGMIDGYFAESPYTVMQRSSMVAGNREIEVLNENDITELNLMDTSTYPPSPATNGHYHFISSLDLSNDGYLGNSIGDGVVHTHTIVSGVVQPYIGDGHTHSLLSERWDYIGVIQLYDSTYNPSGEIENSYVKVVTPYLITLPDNQDKYVYATLPSVETSDKLYYPELGASEDYPKPAGRPPARSNYNNYNDYQLAMDEYNAKLENIHDYEWYMYQGNRFTEVEFSTTGALNISNNKVFLGRVTTRNGQVTNVDVSKVDSIANMQASIKKVAAEYITNHRHGGSGPYDPPKIRLETDIRQGVLYSYNSNNGLATFSITERNTTSVSLGHVHSYEIDASGNGQTLDQNGSTYPHFHKISDFIVGNQEKTENVVDTHTHTINTNISSSDTWTDSSSYIVYVNDVEFADETTTYVHAYPDKKQITFDKGISVLNNKYSCSFPVTLIDDQNQTITLDYYYEGREVSVYRFMLKMINDYNKKFAIYYTESSYISTETGDEVSNSGIVLSNLQNHPFLFINENTDGSTYVSGLGDIQLQSSAAQILLSKVGDVFTFTPDAAKNIAINLLEVGHIDSVKIEILGNTEVTGKLRAENILFINANKILIGELSIERIPFISHAGRMNEQFLPLQYGMYSNDGFKYEIVPTITKTNLGHYHKVFVDTNVNGATTSVMVGNESIIYETDDNKNIYFISHSHGINGGIISESSSNGLMAWQNNVAAANLTSSVHTHEIVNPVNGNNKSIYAVKEDAVGNIYVGTSDGFIMIPVDASYEFVINSLIFYAYGVDFWSAFKIAVSQYEAQTEKSIDLTDSTRSQIELLASTYLIEDNSNFYVSINNYPNRPSDQIMIKKVSSFNIPNFGYTQIKKSYEVLPNETVLGIVQDQGSSVDLASNSASVMVSRDFNNIPIWSIELNDVITSPHDYLAASVNVELFVIGPDVASKSSGINMSPYQPWSSINLPISVGVARKVIKDYNKNYWVCTNGGILVSRNYTNGTSLIYTSLPSGQPDILDIVEPVVGSILCASVSGIFKTTNSGKGWSKIFDVIGGFKQVLRDKTLDRTDSLLGHYHQFEVNADGNGFLGESIGIGTVHIHSVESWQVIQSMNHTHTIKSTLYALDFNSIIYRSQNSGRTWKSYSYLPSGECGEIFASFGNLFVNKEDGLYRSSKGITWEIVLSKKVYSFEWIYELTGFFVGCDNTLYNTFNGTSFEIVHEFVGNPSAILMNDGVKKNFGYAYSNASKTFYLKNILVDSSNLLALVDFEKWYAQGGGWSVSDLYDIYIENKRVLSTKYNQDDRSIDGYNFQVSPSDALLDFAAETSLVSGCNVYDSVLIVNDATGFNSGDNIVISNSNQSNHFEVASISGNNLNLTGKIDVTMPALSRVSKLSSLNGSSNVSGNIYNTLLSNIGINTHEEIEDGIALYSDYRPFKFNDTYLSDLLQLTQATRYVYPDINSMFINDTFYDFRYSWSNTDPLYPSIYNYIDVLTSDIYNQNFYDSKTNPKKAKSINKILIGYGAFDGFIFVATDIGVFWAKIANGYEANWFYVSEIPYPAYDLIIFGTSTLIVASNNGTYKTLDMKTWTLQNNPAISYPSYCLGLRWVNKGAVITPEHTADFSLDETDANNVSGVITAQIGTPYVSFYSNREIQITNAGDKNGVYIINSIEEGGSKLIVSPAFEGPQGIVNNVIITMGDWWSQWNGDLNTSNENLTNTLLVGGLSHISYNDGGDLWSWYESTFDISDFSTKSFLPLTSGKMMAVATGSSASSLENYVLKSEDIGKTWTTLENFPEISGNILYYYVSDFNNTVIEVSYLSPNDAQFSDNNLEQLDISIFSPNSTVAIFRGKIVSNQKRGDIQNIVIFGNEAYYNLQDDLVYTFIIYPSKVNSMIETSKQTLLYGTNRGIYTDVNTIVSNDRPNGSISGAGITGQVSKIDVSGQIKTIDFDSGLNMYILSVYSEDIIRGSDSIGKKFYITDTNPVEVYTISENQSSSVGDEANIYLSAALIQPMENYIGKRFVIVGSKSRVYVDWDLPVLGNQFNGGILYIVSNGLNRGKSYRISANNTNYNNLIVGITSADNTNYIDLTEAIVPQSTLINPNIMKDPVTGETLYKAKIRSGVNSSLADTWLNESSYIRYFGSLPEVNNAEPTVAPPLSVGQKIMPLDVNNRLTLWVNMARTFKENELAGMNMSISGNVSGSVVEFPIYSSESNSFTLESTSNINDLSLFIFDKSAIGKSFSINDSMFEQLPAFNHLSTSVDSGHYHDVTILNNVASGVIDSFSYVDESYVDMVVIDTVNFNVPMVQASGDLFNDAKIVFTNIESINLRYNSEVVSHTIIGDNIVIRVKIGSSSSWNFVYYDIAKISSGWRWEIDSTYYGYTQGTMYSDFNIVSSGITKDIERTDDTIKVSSSNSMIVGDKIRIQDDTLSYEYNYISQIIDTETIKISTLPSRKYFKENNPQIKVLRDSFTNIADHVHQIRNNEVEVLSVSEYLDKGYPSQHTHRILPLVEDVSVLLNQSNRLIAMGSSSKIYDSYDNGQNWNEVVDLNNFLEGSNEIDGISTGVLNNNKIIIGATNGNLFVQYNYDGEIIKLEKPTV